MPVLPPVSGVFRAVMQYTWNGQEVRNVLHFQKSTPAIPWAPEDLAAALETWWRANIKPTQTNLISLHHIMVQDLGPSSPPATMHAVASPQAGSLATASAPNNVSIVLTLRTPFAGRSFRGRIFHCGLATSQYVGNNITSAHLATLIASYSLLMDVTFPVSFVHAQLGVLSYYHLGAVRATPVFTAVTGIDSDGIIDSQRRRLPGRGR